MTLVPEPREPYEVESWENVIMVCRVCGETCNAFRLAEGGTPTWFHASVWKEHDHDADPQPGDATMGICDFCHTPGPRWQVYGDDLSAYLGHADTGLPVAGEATHTYGERWSACDPCDALITAGDIDGLISRHVRVNPGIRAGTISPTHARTLNGALISRYVPSIHRREMIPGLPPVRMSDIPPTKLPKVRDALARSWYGERGARHIIASARDRPIMLPCADLGIEDTDTIGLLVGAQDITQQAATAFCARIQTGLLVGEMYWVAPKFTVMAITAGRSLPDLSITEAELPRVNPQDRTSAPVYNGLVVWQQPIMRLTGTTREGDIVAASWCRVPGGIWMVFYIRADQAMNNHDIQALREDCGWFIPASPGGGAPFGVHKTAEDRASQLIGTLLATWLLLKQPGMATVVEEQPDKATRRAYGRAGRPPPLVRVVNLRQRPRPVDQAGDRTGGKWTRRVWMGRGKGGLWRTFWMGPGRTIRDRRWIAEYLTGTDDMPMTEYDTPPTVHTLR